MNFINSLKGKYPVIFLGENGQIRRQNVAFSELSFFVLPDDKTLRRASENRRSAHVDALR